MTALIFDTCCGCIELRTGCLIIGYLNLVYSIIYVIATLAIGLVVTVSSQEIKDELDKNHVDATALSIVAIITIVIILLYLILNIVFLVGVHQNKRGHVRVYLILNVIFLVIYVLNFFASLAGIVTWSGVLQSLIIIALDAYFLLVIRSFYYKMDSTSHQPAIFNTA